MQIQGHYVSSYVWTTIFLGHLRAYQEKECFKDIVTSSSKLMVLLLKLSPRKSGREALQSAWNIQPHYINIYQVFQNQTNSFFVYPNFLFLTYLHKYCKQAYYSFKKYKTVFVYNAITNIISFSKTKDKKMFWNTSSKKLFSGIATRFDISTMLQK